MNTPNPPGKKRRTWVWIVAGLAAVALLVALRATSSGGSSAGSGSGYQIEDGVVAWRPMDRGQRFAATVLTLGLAVNSEAVVGRTLSSANARTFQTIGSQHGHDRSNVWFQATQIVGADPKTFDVLDLGFSRDATHVWKAATQVLTLEANSDADIEVHSAHILSVGSETWLAGIPSISLPERPVAPPIHFCRNWFEMNDAIWLGSRKMLPLEKSAAVLDCDSSQLQRYEDGVPREDISDNEGLLLRAGTDLWRLRLTGEMTELAKLPEPIADTQLLGNSARDSETLLARAETGMVYAVRPRMGATVQQLGRFDALPDKDATFLSHSFLLGDRFFTLNDRTETGGPPITDHGPAVRYGDMVLANGTLFHGTRVIGQPGDLPIRLVRPATLLVGASCINFGNFVTDVPDTAAEASEIVPRCQTMRRPPDILYDGMRISFVMDLAELGPGETDPLLTQIQLGHISIENEADEPRTLTTDFLAGFDLKVVGTPIAPPPDAWPEQGVTLGPGESHQWTLSAQSDADPRSWGWSLAMRHNARYAAIFGSATFYIGEGQFTQ